MTPPSERSRAVHTITASLSIYAWGLPAERASDSPGIGDTGERGGGAALVSMLIRVLARLGLKGVLAPVATVSGGGFYLRSTYDC